MPITDQEKVAKFSEDVLREATKKAQEITQTAKEMHDVTLNEGVKTIMQEKDEYLSKEKKIIWREISRRQSTHIMKLREEVLLYRKDLIDSLNGQVRKKLEDFTNTKEYESYLVNLCLAVTMEYPMSFTIYLAPKDMEYKKRIIKAVEKQAKEQKIDPLPLYSVDSSEDIKIGGAGFSSSCDNIIIDRTLDASLVLSKDEIIQLLGPVVKEY